MHIGIVSPCSSGPLADLLPGSGGVDLGCGVHFMATLVRALIDRGHRVSVVTLSPEISESKILKGPELTYFAYPERTRRRMRDLFKVEREGLREGIRLAKPDVLHAHWTYEFAMACMEAKLPAVVTMHDNAFQQLRFSKDLYRLGRLYIQMQIIRSARHLTAVSPYLAASLSWLAQGHIEVIPNPIQVPKTNWDTIEHRAGPVKIATVLNGWGNRKNAKAAIKAFDLLRREVPDAEMSMFGYDFEEGGLASRWASSKHLTQNIRFCGLLAPRDLYRRLEEMSVLLHPALEEACPLSILESMALGLPVVAGEDSGGVPWVLDGGKAGFLTDVRDPKKITETLITCIQKREDREERRRNAHCRALDLFSPGSVAKQYENMYEQALTVH